MSSQIAERELVALVSQLQQQGRHCDAAVLDMAIFHAKGYLPDLLRIRDEWAAELKGQQSTSSTR